MRISVFAGAVLAAGSLLFAAVSVVLALISLNAWHRTASSP